MHPWNRQPAPNSFDLLRPGFISYLSLYFAPLPSIVSITRKIILCNSPLTLIFI